MNLLRKITLAMVASVLLFATSCVKNEVSDEVKELRKEQLNLAKALTTEATATADIKVYEAALAKAKNDAEVKAALAELAAKEATYVNQLAEDKLKHDQAVADLAQKVANIKNADVATYLGKYTTAYGKQIQAAKDKVAAQTLLANKQAELANLNKALTNGTYPKFALENAVTVATKAVSDAQAKLDAANAALKVYQGAKEKPDEVKTQIATLKTEVTDLKNEKERETITLAGLTKTKDEAQAVVTNYNKVISDVEGYDTEIKAQEGIKKAAEKNKATAQLAYDQAKRDSTKYAAEYQPLKDADDAAKIKEDDAKTDDNVQNAKLQIVLGEMTAAGMTGPYPYFTSSTDVDFTSADSSVTGFAALATKYETERKAKNKTAKALADADAAHTAATNALSAIESSYNNALAKCETESANVNIYQSKIDKADGEIKKQEDKKALVLEEYNTAVAGLDAANTALSKAEKAVTDQQNKVNAYTTQISAKEDEAANLQNILNNLVEANGLIAKQEETVKTKEDNLAKAQDDLSKAKADLEKYATTGTTVETLNANIKTKEKEIAEQEAEVAKQTALEAQYKAEADIWKSKLDAALTAVNS